MSRLYLVVGSKRACVAACRDVSDIDLAKIPIPLGGPVEIHEIGVAHAETPPRCLLVGDVDDVTLCRPLGRKIGVCGE